MRLKLVSCYVTLDKKNIKVAIVMGSNSDYSVMRECELALKKLSLTHIPIVALAKRLEEVFLPGNINAQSIPKHSSGLML